MGSGVDAAGKKGRPFQAATCRSIYFFATNPCRGVATRRRIFYISIVDFAPKIPNAKDLATACNMLFDTLTYYINKSRRQLWLN